MRLLVLALLAAAALHAENWWGPYQLKPAYPGHPSCRVVSGGSAKLKTELVRIHAIGEQDDPPAIDWVRRKVAAIVQFDVTTFAPAKPRIGEGKAEMAMAEFPQPTAWVVELDASVQTCAVPPSPQPRQETRSSFTINSAVSSDQLAEDARTSSAAAKIIADYLEENFDVRSGEIRPDTSLNDFDLDQKDWARIADRLNKAFSIHLTPFELQLRVRDIASRVNAALPAKP
jgi:hypothetical protein